MIKEYTILISLLLIRSVYGQVVFEKTYGTIDNDGGYSIHICSDNSYVITGYTSNFYTGYNDIYVVKIDELGDTIWTKAIGEADIDERGYSITQDNNNSYIIAGQTIIDNSYVPVLSKFNENGQLLWFKDYQNYILNGFASKIITSHDFNYVFGGIENNSKSQNDELLNAKGYLIKTDQEGAVLWKQYYGGGAKQASNQIETSDFGFALCGTYKLDGYHQKTFVVKADEDGGLDWDNSFGEDDYAEYANDIKQTSDGGYIICGSKYLGNIILYGKIYITKINNIGVEEWSRTYDFGEEKDTRGVGIEVASDGGYFICGDKRDYPGANKNILLIRTNEIGDTIWTRQFGGVYDDQVSEMHITNDGGLIMCGSTRSFGLGGLDIYVIKTNQDGLITNTNNIDYPLSRIKIYPNPSRNIFTIKTEKEIVSFKIFNMQGDLMKQNDDGLKNESGLQIDLSSFAPGVYYGVFEINNTFQTRKMIKQ